MTIMEKPRLKQAQAVPVASGLAYEGANLFYTHLCDYDKP